MKLIISGAFSGGTASSNVEVNASDYSLLGPDMTATPQRDGNQRSRSKRLGSIAAAKKG